MKADLILLQEVQGRHESHSRRIKDWPEEPQFEYLAQELWPHFAYGKNAVYTSGHHGNAILSRYPILMFENIDISTNRLEKRGMLHGMIELSGKQKPLHVLCLHLGLLEAERTEQLRKLCGRIESHVPHDEPLVIGGDFNDWRGKVSRPFECGLEIREAYREVHGKHARTFPSWLPTLRLDRIYCRGFGIKDAKCLNHSPWSELSDHVALVADLTV